MNDVAILTVPEVLSPISRCALGQMHDKQKGRVVGLHNVSAEVQSRLLALGLFPGQEVQVLRRSPFGDPLQIKSGATLLSVRLSEAKSIEMELLS